MVVATAAQVHSSAASLGEPGQASRTAGAVHKVWVLRFRQAYTRWCRKVLGCLWRQTVRMGGGRCDPGGGRVVGQNGWLTIHTRHNLANAQKASARMAIIHHCLKQRFHNISFNLLK